MHYQDITGRLNAAIVSGAFTAQLQAQARHLGLSPGATRGVAASYVEFDKYAPPVTPEPPRNETVTNVNTGNVALRSTSVYIFLVYGILSAGFCWCGLFTWWYYWRKHNIPAPKLIAMSNLAGSVEVDMSAGDSVAVSPYDPTSAIRAASIARREAMLQSLDRSDSSAEQEGYGYGGSATPTSAALSAFDRFGPSYDSSLGSAYGLDSHRRAETTRVSDDDQRDDQRDPYGRERLRSTAPELYESRFGFSRSNGRADARADSRVDGRADSRAADSRAGAESPQEYNTRDSSPVNSRESSARFDGDSLRSSARYDASSRESSARYEADSRMNSRESSARFEGDSRVSGSVFDPRFGVNSRESSARFEAESRTSSSIFDTPFPSRESSAYYEARFGAHSRAASSSDYDLKFGVNSREAMDGQLRRSSRDSSPARDSSEGTSASK